MTAGTGFVLVATLKDEGPYLLEWLAHHMAVGFGHFVICHNDCSDGTDLMLDRLQEMGLLRALRTRISRGGIQRSAYRQAAACPAVRTAQWVYVTDGDEMLNIHLGDGSVQALVAASEVTPDGRAADSIAVPWKRFGNAGIRRFADLPLTEQFLRAEPADGRLSRSGAYAKSLMRGVQDVRRLGIHSPVPRPDLGRPWVKVAPGGQPVPETMPHMRTPADGWALAQVNHYALRSMDAFLMKKLRGSANSNTVPHDIRYWQRFDRNDEADTTILRTGRARAERLSGLLADDRLATLHHLAVVWHRKRIAEVRMSTEFEALAEKLAAASAAPVDDKDDADETERDAA